MSSLTGALFGKKSTPINNPTTYETLPDFGKDLLKQLIDQGQSFATANPTYSAPERDVLNMLVKGVGTPSIGGFNFGQRASDAFGNAGSMYDAAAGYLESSMPFLNRGGSAITSGEIGSSISDFMNPFENEVVANTARDISTMGSGLFSDARSLISDAGASGSNRGDFLAQGIAKDMTNTLGDFSSNLRNTGFQSAASNALSRLMGDRSNALTAGGSMINAAGTANQTGAGYGQNANALMGARMNMDTLRGTNRDRIMSDLNNTMSAGGQIRQEPLLNMDMLAQLFNLIPQGGGNVAAMRDNKGFLGRAADIVGTFMKAGGA
jgi:hypothetical protein